MSKIARNIMTRRIAPGIWIDGNGEGHISATELLDLVRLPHTEENIRNVINLASEVLRKHTGRNPVVRLKPDELPGDGPEMERPADTTSTGQAQSSIGRNRQNPE